MLDNQAMVDHRKQREQARQEEQRQRAQDLLLQEALAALERGRPLASVLEELRWRWTVLGGVKNERSAEMDGEGRQSLPGGNDEPLSSSLASDLQELENLVQLVAAMGYLAHLLIPQINWAQQRASLSAGRWTAAAEIQHTERQTTMNTKIPIQPRSNSAKTVWPTDGPRGAGLRRPRSRPHTAVRMIVSLFAVLLIFALSLTSFLWLSGPRGAQAAALMDTSGQVEALGADGSWAALADGDRVAGGQRLRTGPASRVTLVFFDGTRTTLEPNSDVTLTQVGGDWGGVLRVSLTQNAGRTTHSVVPLRGDRSAFTVLTPSSAASVHGTNFDVAVDALGRSRFGVNTGRVLVSSEAEEVFLTAGQATTSQTDGALEDPAYQFTLHGTLSSMEGSTWIMEGVPFTVLPEAEVSGDPQVGSEISVVGRVLASGEWVADSIALAETPDETGDGDLSSFTGTLESMTGGVWQVGGWTVAVDGATELAAGLEAGKAVRVTFVPAEDGRWLAIRIELLEEPEGEEPTEEPTTQPADTSAQPILAFSPGEQAAGACGAGELSLTGTLVNTAIGEANAATDLELASQVVEGAGFVDWVELDPLKFASIPAGGSASFTVKLALNDSFDAAAEPQVELRVFLLGADGTRLTIKVENVCEATEEPEVTQGPTGTESPAVTDTPTITVTETVTPTVGVTVTETVTPTVVVTLPVTSTETLVPTVEATPVVTSTVETACTGAQPHPTGMRLALAYGVPYEEIMAWFCQGFGFGEIDLAYSLSWVSGRPVAELFAMKSGGMGWGEIKQLLETKGNPKKWATPPPATSLPGSSAIQPSPVPENPSIQSTPVPPGKPNDKPDKPGKQKKP